MRKTCGLERIKTVQVFEANITHNLGEMASKAGLYEVLWMPEVFRPRNAADLIVGLEKGIDKMKKDPDFFRQFDAKNGCGTYDQFLPWLEK